jgi:hypothetical protein
MKQIDMFEDPTRGDVPAGRMVTFPAGPARMQQMHKRYGPCPAAEQGARCGDCRHVVTRSFANNYYKCDLARCSAGAATDWRLRWPACGRFERRAETLRKPRTLAYCTCGAQLVVLGDDPEDVIDAQTRWRREHFGYGHGNCDAETAKRARSKANAEAMAEKMSWLDK